MVLVEVEVAIADMTPHPSALMKRSQRMEKSSLSEEC